MTSRRTVQRPASAGSPSEANRRFAVGLAHAFGGAIVFAVPLLMTMEMWRLGFHMDPLRLTLFLLLNIPLLVALSYYAGFEETNKWTDDVLDAFAANAVGFVVATVLLLLFAIIGPGMSTDEIIGKIAVQAVPASIGAMLARSQFGESQPEEEEKRKAYDREGLFIAVAGAFYFSIALAVTKELELIPYKMTPWHVIGLLLLSLTVTHGFIHAAIVQGKGPVPPDTIPFAAILFRFTVVNYAIALLVSVYVLWIF